VRKKRRELVRLVRTAPFTGSILSRETEAWGVWGVRRGRGQLTFALFSPRREVIEALAAGNPLCDGGSRKVYFYDTPKHGRKWCVNFPPKQFSYIALRATRSSCSAHQELFSKILALREANDRVIGLASPRARRRRLAAQAWRDGLLEEIAELRLTARDACPLRARARQADALTVGPSAPASSRLTISRKAATAAMES
jgi:hypothetical protein